MYENVSKFEEELAEFTSSKYAIATDCCTHAIEICLRIQKPESIKSTAYTYLSVPMTFKKLNLKFELTDEDWIGEYNLHGSNIWDSARLLKPKMYRKNQLQCISFGNGKPIDNKRGGAILCDSKEFYNKAKKMSFDGRDLSFQPWIKQKEFQVGYHYNMPIEHAIKLSELLKKYSQDGNFEPKKVEYPDCRNIIFTE